MQYIKWEVNKGKYTHTYIPIPIHIQLYIYAVALTTCTHFFLSNRLRDTNTKS